MSEDTYTVQLHRRVFEASKVARVVGPPVKRSSLHTALAWVDHAVISEEDAVSMSSSLTNTTTWFGLGRVIVEDKGETMVGPGTIQIPPCFVYDGPENLTMEDLPPDVTIERVLIEKEHFEAHLDNGDFVLVERVEADLLHKAYMFSKEIERERVEYETHMAAKAAKE